MTIKELLESEPHLITDEKQTGVYLIPIGKFGFTSFPVGTYNEEGEFELNSDAVLVTIDQYDGLKQRTYCWQDGACVRYTAPKEVMNARETCKKYDDTLQRKADAKQWLFEHDYVGVKIAEAFLMGTDEELAALKQEYADVIEEAKEKRAIVNECEQILQTIDIAHAQEILAHEFD